MTMTISAASSSLLQGSPPDTVAMVISPSLLSTVESVSTIVLGVAVLGVLIALLIILVQLRKLGRSLGTVAKRLEKDAAPVMERARSVATNVEFISMAVRTDVQKLTASVSGLNERLREASARMEERIQDFTALVEVLQNEAEDLALDTAAAVRGVRAGTRSLAGRGDAEPEDRKGEGAYVFPSLPELDGDEG
jgi:methyl-accepting chemotaxis protein